MLGFQMVLTRNQFILPVMVMVFFLAGGGVSSAADRFLQLCDAIRLNETIDIMIEEGLDYGDSIRMDMFPGVDEEIWKDQVAQIYQRAQIEQEIQDAMHKELDGVDLEPLIEYFGSPSGQNITTLELSSRRALVDQTLIGDAAERYLEMERENDPLIGHIKSLIKDGDLIENNVAGTLSSYLKFYQGLVDGGALEWSEAELLQEVWNHEAQVRIDAEEWLHGYFVTAYGPLSDEDMTAYVALWKSKEGQALNRALLGSFDKAYQTVSYQLGIAAAKYLGSEPI